MTIMEKVQEIALEHEVASIKILSCQLRPEPRENEKNLDRLINFMSQAPKGTLVVTPELYLSGYVSSNSNEVALALDSALLDRLRDACREYGVGVVVGFVEASGEGKPFNSLLVVDSDGSDLLCYRKTHLFPAEYEAFDSGDQLASFEFGGLKVGLLNCYEIELPEPARALVLDGCDMLLTSSANMFPYFEEHRIPGVARALENRVNHVYVNQVLQGEELLFVGGSRWVRPDGSVGFEAEQDRENVTLLEFSLRSLLDGQTDFVQTLRPKLY